MNSSYNKSVAALEYAQKEFRGVAEQLGLTDDDDVVKMIKEIRKERANNNKTELT